MHTNSAGGWSSMSDKTLIAMIGHFVRHHRINQNQRQDDISKAAGISRSTLSLLERGEVVSLDTLMRVLRVLNLLHIMEVFEVSSELSPLEYAKIERQKRKRSRVVHKNLVSAGEDVEW